MEIKLEHKNTLRTEPIGGLLRKFAIPSIIAMLVGALYNIVDQIFIGHKIGELGNAATNVTFPIITACIALALLVGIGGAASFNLSLGEGKKELASSYIGNSLVLLFIFGLSLLVISQIFLTPLLKAFGSPDSVLGYAKTYLRITSLGFPFLIMTSGGGHLIRADGSPKYAMFSNLLGAIINTILDPLLIFGLNMDMAGAAWATVIGQAFSFLSIIIYFIYYKRVKLAKENFLLKGIYLKKITSLGTTPAFNQISMMVVQIIMNNSLVYYGRQSIYGEDVPLAAAGIISKVAMIFFAIIIGISQGMQPIASYNYGAKQYKRVKRVYQLAITSSAIFALGAFLIFQLIPKTILSLFGNGTEEYFKFAIAYFRIYMFFTFINFLQPVSSNLFTSIGKPKKGIFLSLTRQILFLIPLIIILPLIFGIDGIIYAGPIADLMAALVSVIMITREFSKMKEINSN